MDMTKPFSLDEFAFRKILMRNVALPLGVGIISVLVFAALLSYLMNVIGWVDHTDRVINNANEAVKLSVDMETGMRGFLLTGDEHFLDPYEVAKPRIKAELEGLKALVADNPQQVDRLNRLEALQEAWNQFGTEMINLRRQNLDFRSAVQAGRGKRLTDEIRSEYEGFVAMEQQLRIQRSEEVTRTTWVGVTVYLLFVIMLSG